MRLNGKLWLPCAIAVGRIKFKRISVFVKCVQERVACLDFELHSLALTWNSDFIKCISANGKTRQALEY